MNFEKDFEDWNFTECTEAAHLMKKLLEGPEWKLVAGIIIKQIHARTDGIILQPLEKLDDSLKQEYAKGEVAALRLVLTVPDTLLDELTSMINDKREPENARDDLDPSNE